MNNKKAKLIRQFAKKFKLSPSAIKRTYLSLTRDQRQGFSDQLQVLLKKHA